MSGEKKTTVDRRDVLAAGASVSLTALAGCFAPGQRVTETSERTFTVPGDTSVAVANRNGDVRVERGESTELEVEVVERTRFDPSLFDGVGVEGTTEEGVFTVATTYDRDPLAGRVRVDLTVRLPEPNPLSSASTQNGDAVVEGVTGDATVETVNGDAEAHDVAGYVTLRSSNGDTVARATTGVDGAETTNGEVDVEVLAIRDETALRSTNGDVAALLASDLEATIDARTANGEVEVAGLELGDRRQTARQLSGDLNGGGPTLRLRTTNGDVELSGR
jgi:DUF4097 and DUF4098 domain-containing protein YvlB